jgi:hypothetical protein
VRGRTLLVSLMLCASVARAQDFEAVFGNRYASAVAAVRTRQSSWRAACEDLGADARLLIPVVFPELLRRSIIREGAEDLGLATLYVSRGSRAADFSVGIFQMKPSFAEAVEGNLIALPSIPDAIRPLIDFPGTLSERDRRAARYRRLREEGWQLRYLAGFALIVGTRFPLESLRAEDQIRFLAAAYNHGFWLSWDEITAAESLQLFPNGVSRGSHEQYRYTDVAVDFYVRYWRVNFPGE